MHVYVNKVIADVNPPNSVPFDCRKAATAPTVFD